MSAIITQFFLNNRHRIPVFFSVAALLFISNVSYAFAPNPSMTCPSGFAQGSLTSSDYTKLLTSSNDNNFFNVAGGASASIPLQLKMTVDESSNRTINDNFSIINSAGYSALNVGRNFPSPAAYTDITLSFRNGNTQQPMYLTNVAISAFDVDYANSGSSLFDDYVRIEGITQAGTTIDGTLQRITGSNVAYLQGLNNTTAFNCSSRDLDTRCQGSITFEQPVSSVKIRYTNNPVYVPSNPTNQEIQLRVDNYCYAPRYTFSGTVFNDNGGINDNDPQVRADNATINSGVYNNANYFNGTFERTVESGIAGSRVALVDCASPTTVYASQTVTGSGANIGNYQLDVPANGFNGNTNVCLVESRSGTSYPISTSSMSKAISLVASTYSYPNNNFGRVLDKNVALVLKKYQYVHDCASTLNYSTISNSTDPTTGFSTNPMSNIDPRQCIAYKITATNRANVDIDDFVMRDVLQKKGVNNASATSVLALPPRPESDYADNLSIGQNGTVVTQPFTVNKRTLRSFYFNTKYDMP